MIKASEKLFWLAWNDQQQLKKNLFNSNTLREDPELAPKNTLYRPSSIA